MNIDITPAAFTGIVGMVGTVIGLAGVIVIAGGMLFATYRALRLPPDEHGDRYVRYRREVGQAILLGLEFLVAADIIETVAVAPTIEKVLVLGGIVLIRTFLSLALEVELTGRWPWRTAQENHPGPPL
jgi:uncharacterized membrane protein